MLPDLKNPVVGIDPGANGCAWVWWPMVAPSVRFLNTGDSESAIELATRLRDSGHDATSIYVERNHPIPGMGVMSAFTFGRAYGTLLTALAACDLRPVIVTAQAWRRWALGGKVPGDRKGRDAATVQAAMDRWPEIEWPKAKVKREAMAAAMFIGAYGHNKGL